MKKKLFLILVMVFVFAMVLAFAVSADTIHTPERLAKYGTTVTVRVTTDDPDGTTVNLFDSEGNALIWYLDANNELQSIRADDERVKYKAAGWSVTTGNSVVGNVKGPEVLGVEIVLDDTTTIGYKNIVVFNIMDDDVVTNAGSSSYFDMPVTCMKEFMRDSKNLEYLYLRLDTIAIQRSAFSGCSNLKYVNIEDLTELRRIGDSSQFSGCSSLLSGQVLDLSNTKLYSIDGGGTFNGVPIKGLILPSTCTTFGEYNFQGNSNTTFIYPEVLTSIPKTTFNNSKNLQTVYLNASVQSIGDNAFLSCNSLTTICYVGTKAQLETLITNTSATGNDAFLAVVGENNANVISYADYLALEDKSGKYAIYDYSYCEAFNDSVHEAVDTATDCTQDSDCKNCTLKGAIKSEFEDHVYVEALTYENGYTSNGLYTKTCQNLERCTCGNIVKDDVNPIFSEGVGFSTDGDYGIAGGYLINMSELNEYKRLNGALTIGIMIINPEYLDGKTSFFDENGMINTEGGKLQIDMTENKYANVSVSITGFTGQAADMSVIIALYAYSDPNDVQFVQSQTTVCASENVTIGEQTLYTVTLNSVKEANSDLSNLGDYVMPSQKEQE